MSLLDVLPTELLLHVCSFLYIENLACVCRVNHPLRLIAEPYLYRHVVLDTIETEVPLIGLFISTILLRPVLANYVRSLNIQWDDNFRAHLKPNPEYFYDTALLTSAISRLQLDITLRSPTDHVMLLLHLLPRLELLDLAPPGELDLFDQYNSRGGPAILPRLRRVRCWDDQDPSVNHGSFITLIMLPSICSLEVSIQADLEPVEMVTLAKRSRLTELTLHACDIGPDTLEKILNIPTALTKFTYMDCPLDFGLNGPAVGLALRRSVGESLQHLALAWGVESDWELDQLEPDITSHFQIGSLLDWPVLTSVRCTLTVLLGTSPDQTVLGLGDVLPAVIREFEIVWDDHWTAAAMADEIFKMMEYKLHGGLQKLEALTIPKQALGEEARVILQICEANAVQLKINRGWAGAVGWTSNGSLLAEQYL